MQRQPGAAPLITIIYGSAHFFNYVGFAAAALLELLVLLAMLTTMDTAADPRGTEDLYIAGTTANGAVTNAVPATKATTAIATAATTATTATTAAFVGRCVVGAAHAGTTITV